MNYHNHIKSTAQAWNISQHDTYKLFAWVRYNVAPYARSSVLTTLLRRKHKSATIKPDDNIPVKE